MNTEPSRVLVALRVDATPERAFAAFTDEIGRWWRPNQLFQFSTGRSGTLTFEPGPSGRLVETYDDGSSSYDDGGSTSYAPAPMTSRSS